MSLDVTLYGKKNKVDCRCPNCGDNHKAEQTETLFDYNITHNLGDMADAADLYNHLWRPEEVGVTKAGDLIGKLALGLDTLKAEPEYFKSFNPKNGWGNYDNLVEFVEKYLQACQDHPEATIYVSR